MKHHHSHSDPEKPAEQAPADNAAAADAPAPEGAPAEATPAGDVAALAAERDNLLARLQRLSADYVNYQKRVQKDISHAHDFGNESIIKAMLVILDDMERALAAAATAKSQDDPLAAGLKLMHDKMLESLKNFGLVEIHAEGQPFDPEHHSAVLQEETDKVPPNTVVRELQKGYGLKGRTLRPAMVIVSKEPAKE